MFSAYTQKIKNENLKYKIMDLIYYHSNTGTMLVLLTLEGY